MHQRHSEASHLFSSSYGQCACKWCGKYRNGKACSMTMPMRYALKEFAAKNGRTWKSKLVSAWATGEPLGPELQQVRNVLGPTKLMRFKSRLLERVN